MTNGAYQVQPMAEVPPETTTLTTYIDDDPAWPTLTMTNGILVPVTATDFNPDTETEPVPCQYYTVTSFCRNPKHLDLNYANQHQFTWNDVIPAISSFVVNQKPREIIHKIHIEGNNLDQEGNEENRQFENNNNETSFLYSNNRTGAAVDLALVPVRRNRKKSKPPLNHHHLVKATSVPPMVESRIVPVRRNRKKSVPPEHNHPIKATSVPPSFELRRSDPNPTNIPIAPPRNRNLSNFRSFSQSKESLEFQGAPPPPYRAFSPTNNNWTHKRCSVPSIVDVNPTDEILSAQFERKEKLRNAVQSKQMDLTNLRRDVQFLQKQLEALLHIDKLTKENERLAHQCNLMTSDIDFMTNFSIPLGETDENLYLYRHRESIPRNETTSNPSTPSTSSGLLSGPGPSYSSSGRLPTGSQQFTPNRNIKVNKPPRPPPPDFANLSSRPTTLKIESGWDCTECTFRNHPDLQVCEQCEMIRSMYRHSTPTPPPPCPSSTSPR